MNDPIGELVSTLWPVLLGFTLVSVIISKVRGKPSMARAISMGVLVALGYTGAYFITKIALTSSFAP